MRNNNSRRDRQESNRRQSNSQNDRNEWYSRDPMDERSGYRDEERDNSQRMDSGDVRGYNDHYRYDQIYHNFYGSNEYNPDRRNRSSSNESAYDSDRYSRGQGAYGTTSSGRASWDTGLNSDANRWSYNKDYYSNNSSNNRDQTSRTENYGASQGSWSPNEDSSTKSKSYSGRGPKNYKRSDERIKEEVCEMLTRHNSIDADDIDVEVKDGEVTLTGNVSERRMKHLAEDCAEQTYGVKDVVNNIRVKKSDETESSVKDKSKKIQNPNH